MRNCIICPIKIYKSLKRGYKPFCSFKICKIPVIFTDISEKVLCKNIQENCKIDLFENLQATKIFYSKGMMIIKVIRVIKKICKYYCKT